MILTRDGSGTVVRHLNGIRQFSFVDKDELAVVDDGDTERFFRGYDMMAEEHAAGTVACTRLSLGPSRVPTWRACMREALICDTDGDHVLTGTCADRAVLAVGGDNTVDGRLGKDLLSGGSGAGVLRGG